MSSCTKKTTGRFVSATRKSPPYAAKDCVGIEKIGADGRMYKPVQDKNGRYAWRVVPGASKVTVNKVLSRSTTPAPDQVQSQTLVRSLGTRVAPGMKTPKVSSGDVDTVSVKHVVPGTLKNVNVKHVDPVSSERLNVVHVHKTPPKSCIKKTTQVYASSKRLCPPYVAKDCVGAIKQGNDGNYYEVKKTKSGLYKWARTTMDPIIHVDANSNVEFRPDHVDAQTEQKIDVIHQHDETKSSQSTSPRTSPPVGETNAVKEVIANPMSFNATLYKSNRQWRVWVSNNTVYTEYGIVGGKLTRSNKEYPSEEKARSVALKQWTDKRTKGVYRLESETASTSTTSTSKDDDAQTSFRPMLANKFDSTKHNAFPYYVQPKLDGVRCIAYTSDDGEVVLQSRTGTRFVVLEHIRQQLRTLSIPKHMILDGELGHFEDGGMGFQEITGLVKRKTFDPRELKINYMVYDIYCLKDPSLSFKERLNNLNGIFQKNSSKNIHLVKSSIVHSLLDIENSHTECVESGFEGIMIRVIKGKYEPSKRSSYLLKHKTFQDAEFTIVGYKEATGSDKGTIVFRCDAGNGKTFDVRPTGSRDERAKMFRQGNSYIGKELTVKYFELTKDGIPRFPVGISVRDYE